MADRFKVLTVVILAVILSACVAKKSQPSGSSAPNSSVESETAAGVTGNWRIGYKYNGKVENASMHIVQEGNTFQGSGQDEPANTAFRIEQGTIQGGQVSFIKRYTNSSDNSPGIQYAGRLTTTSQEGYTGPYLCGDYSVTTAKGRIISGDWDAIRQADQAAPTTTTGVSPPSGKPQPQNEKVQAGAPKASALESEPQEAPLHKTKSDKPPELSGKWNVGFEYQFRTVHSVMFLEQVGSAVSGHGMDDDKEKFQVDGWYYYPRITLVRKYEKAEKHGKSSKTARTMIFKGDVSNIDESDYQGPLLHGKTDGGGMWEAQEFR